MNILKQKYRFFNIVNRHVPPKLGTLFSFGFWTLTDQRIVSLRGNARQFVSNRHTAKTKAWRLTKNENWLSVFPGLLSVLKLVTEMSVVCLDLSEFRGRQVITFAVQTKKGRAIPVYFEIIEYPIKDKSQNTLIINAIENFVSFIGCRPKLVMDRGFACPSIIKHLAKHSHLFIVRIKAGKKLTNKEKELLFLAKETNINDQLVIVYDGLSLRLITSDETPEHPDRWYLITNDFTEKRDEVIADYYHRFEIEEFFKDAKWLAGLEWVRPNKTMSLAVVLWFVILGMWFINWLRKTKIDWKNNHEISIVRYVYETIQRETQFLVLKSLGIKLAGGLRE